ncbi:unnamed protein product, partial [Linum tenue]
QKNPTTPIQSTNHPISKLGDDLLEEILIRLPNPKSTCNCKPVYKRWNSLISSPYFNRRFLSHHQSSNKETPLRLTSNDPLSSSILSFLPVPDVLCGFQGSWWEEDGELLRSFLICNPFTKKWVALPLAPEKINSSNETTKVKLVYQEALKANSTLDLGDGQVFLYSEYQFHVLIGYEAHTMTGTCSDLQVFCSKSRKWSRKERIVYCSLIRCL